jgi:RNA methyltransferase, TrmH family
MTKAQIRLFQSLSRQKYRKEYNAYLVEGDKNAKEWLQSDIKIQSIAVSGTWLQENEALVKNHPEAELLVAEAFELEKITSLQHAQEVVLIVEQPAPAVYGHQEGQWYLYLEKIQDPGNMGTIIRTADWFGIRQLICSPDCVEVYNPKVVQASMGSLLRMDVIEMEPEVFVQENTLPLYVTSLSGRSIKEVGAVLPGVIAMGNESRGISAVMAGASSHQLYIPGLGAAESLNVAVATGIICAELILR